MATADPDPDRERSTIMAEPDPTTPDTDDDWSNCDRCDAQIAADAGTAMSWGPEGAAWEDQLSIVLCQRCTQSFLAWRHREPEPNDPAQ
jgi:hypothetical protein